jgi:hypothetical protein
MAGRARAEHDFDPIGTRKRKRTSSPEATKVKNGSVQLIDRLGLQSATETTTNTTTRAIIRKWQGVPGLNLGSYQGQKWKCAIDRSSGLANCNRNND